MVNDIIILVRKIRTFLLAGLEFSNVLYALFTPYISFNCFIVNVNLQLMFVHSSIDSD